MNNKLIGYIVAGVGLLVFALSYPAARDLIKIPSIGISDIYIMIAGLILILVGGFLAYRSAKAEQPKEVPIYEGTGEERKVVGIQRMGEE
jgi:hypothetical protein